MFASMTREAVGFQIFLCLAQHLAFVAVGKLPGRFGERHPERPLDFDPHVGCEVVDLSGDIAHQVEAHDFEDAFAIAPGADIDIFVIDEFGDRFGHDSGLFLYFANGGGLRFFSRIDQSFGKSQHGASALARRLRWLQFSGVSFLRLDQGNVPDSGNLPKHDSARRNFPRLIAFDLSRQSSGISPSSFAVSCWMRCHARSTWRA